MARTLLLLVGGVGVGGTNKKRERERERERATKKKDTIEKIMEKKRPRPSQRGRCSMTIRLYLVPFFLLLLLSIAVPLAGRPVRRRLHGFPIWG